MLAPAPRQTPNDQVPTDRTPRPDLRPVAMMLGLFSIALSLVACSRPTPADPPDGRPSPPISTPSPAAAGLVVDAGNGETEDSMAPDVTSTELPPEVATARAGDRPAPGSVRATTEVGGGDEAAAGAEDVDEANASPTRAGGDGLAICRDLREAAALALGSQPEALSLRAADVQDPVDRAKLDGCQLAIEAAGEDLTIGQGATTLPGYRLREVLLAAGWRADPAHARLQPGRSLEFYTRSEAMCLVEVRFEPPAGQPCPQASDPTCGLSPVQLDYSIALRCARY